MTIDFSKGISVASGFSLQAKKPLDVRVVAQTLDDLNDLIKQNAAYAGLIVYVEANQAFYKCVKAEAGVLKTYQITMVVGYHSLKVKRYTVPLFTRKVMKQSTAQRRSRLLLRSIPKQ